MNNAVTVPPRISEIVQEYHAKVHGGDVTRTGPDGIEEVLRSYPGAEAMVARFNEARDALKSASGVGTSYVSPIFERDPTASVKDVKNRLLRSAWREVYRGMNIDAISTAKDKKELEMFLEQPPEFSLDAIREKFGDYWLNARQHILRGLAEAFSDLDPAFRSHEKMKIGVKGLPKRVIITNVGGEYSYDSYGTNQLKDVIRSYLAIHNLPNLTYQQIEAMKKEARRNGEADWPGGKLKVYKNGNGHLYFSPGALKDVNLALAEYYGEVLPDSPEGAAEEAKRRPGTEVARDLQFYWTPKDVVQAMIKEAEPRAGDRILEPSCGDGRIMEGVRDYVVEKRLDDVAMAGIEVHAGRAEQARAKGFPVVCGNFLEYPATASFDLVFMNPPFYGQHYLKHIERAIGALKPGGRLVAVLPATAFYDHGKLPGRQYDPSRPYHHRDVWRDLPMGSFREAGTNVATGLWTYWKPKEER